MTIDVDGTCVSGCIKTDYFNVGSRLPGISVFVVGDR